MAHGSGKVLGLQVVLFSEAIIQKHPTDILACFEHGCLFNLLQHPNPSPSFNNIQRAMVIRVLGLKPWLFPTLTFNPMMCYSQGTPSDLRKL